jgi:hypothetical protein
MSCGTTERRYTACCRVDINACGSGVDDGPCIRGKKSGVDLM